MALNPYAPGAGTEPPVMVGRDVQLAIIKTTADLVEAGRRPQHVVLTGLRGVGKTVLLKEGLRNLRDRGWLCGYFEVRRDVDVATALGTIIAGGSSLLPAHAKIRRSLSRLSSSVGGVSLSGSPDGTVALDVTRGVMRPTDIYTESLSVLRILAKAARENGVGVALAIDEVQTFRRADATILLQVLEADEEEDSRVLLLAAGLPTTPVALSKARTYAERFRYEPLDDLSPGDARRAVKDPATALGIHWSGPALDRIVELAHGYPYFLQLFASEAWDLSAGAEVITVRHVQQSESRALSRLENGLYATRYQGATPRERGYLDAMATLAPSGPVRSADVANALGKTLTEMSQVRDNLVRKGVIHSPVSGELTFSVPGFGEYVLRRLAAL
ncbi:MAG TPA: ATP-binding protein [Acidimicrobiales bacterium]|nr:ATP-binding protein [Acidimicrobiales bacterium]